MSTHISSLTFKTASPAPYLRALAHVGSHDSVYVGYLRFHIRVHFLLSRFSQIILLFNDIWQAGCRFMSILHQSGSNCSLERSNDLLAPFPARPTVEMFPLSPRVFYFRTVEPSVSLETMNTFSQTHERKPVRLWTHNWSRRHLSSIRSATAESPCRSIIFISVKWYGILSLPSPYQNRDPAEFVSLLRPDLNESVPSFIWALFRVFLPNNVF